MVEEYSETLGAKDVDLLAVCRLENVSPSTENVSRHNEGMIKVPP